jgi:GGDEF domain-containing protein
MVGSMGFPANVERRASSKQGNAYVAPQPAAVCAQGAVRSREAIMECASREDLVNLLAGEIESVDVDEQSICLALVNLRTAADVSPSYADQAFNAVAKIFRSHLRPSDSIFRFGKTIGLIMHECDRKGGNSVCNRLGQAVSRRLYFGRQPVVVEPVFGIASDLAPVGDRAAALLDAAEAALAEENRKLA